MSIEKATKYWSEYSLKQLKVAEFKNDSYGINHWKGEHLRAVNDLKYYEFMKLEEERKSTNCGNS